MEWVTGHIRSIYRRDDNNLALDIETPGFIISSHTKLWAQGEIATLLEELHEQTRQHFAMYDSLPVAILYDEDTYEAILGEEAPL